MVFRQLFDPASFALTFLIGDPISAEALVIDPLKSQATLILALLAEHHFRLKYVLRTHVHRPDRISCGDLCPRTGATFVVGIRNPQDIPGMRVAEGDRLFCGEEMIGVMETPGHTPGCITYQWRDRIFCGDVLELGGCGQAEDETDAGAMYDSVRSKLFRLADETLVFPGHDYAGRTVSTIAEERKRNAAFSGVSRDLFIARVGALEKRQPSNGQEDKDGSRLVSHSSGKW